MIREHRWKQFLEQSYGWACVDLYEVGNKILLFPNHILEFNGWIVPDLHEKYWSWFSDIAK